MTDNKINIDDLYKKTLRDHKIESTVENLSTYNKMLNKFNFFRFGLSSFNIYYAVLITLVISSVSVIYFNSTPQENKIEHKKIEDRNTKIDLNNTNTESSELKNTENKTTSNNNKNIKTAEKARKTSPVEVLPVNNSIIESPDNGNKESIETDGKDLQLDTTIVIVHDTILVKKKVVITDTIKTVIQKDKKIRGRKRKR